MSLMRTAARITTKCACGTKFDQDPAVILQGKKDLYCSDVCVAKYAPEYACEACGLHNEPGKAAYGLPICAYCQGIAWWSCWRKRIFESSYEAGKWVWLYEAGGTNPLTPYPCKLCERWHASSWSVYEVASDEYNERIAAIAAVFRRLNFDIDEARGYTNNPDGTHEIRERGYGARLIREATDKLLKQGSGAK